MAAPATNSAFDTGANSHDPSGAGNPNINPDTGLSTDYLNHFAEVLMALELAPEAPDCVSDLMAWRPKSYAEHFAGSRLRHRDAVLDAHRAADPELRQALDRAAEALNRSLIEARQQVLTQLSSPAAEALARRTVDGLRPQLLRVAALINGAAPAAAGLAPQAGIDAMFDE